MVVQACLSHLLDEFIYLSNTRGSSLLHNDHPLATWGHSSHLKAMAAVHRGVNYAIDGSGSQDEHFTIALRKERGRTAAVIRPLQTPFLSGVSLSSPPMRMSGGPSLRPEGSEHRTFVCSIVQQGCEGFNRHVEGFHDGRVPVTRPEGSYWLGQDTSVSCALSQACTGHSPGEGSLLHTGQSCTCWHGCVGHEGRHDVHLHTRGALPASHSPGSGRGQHRDTGTVERLASTLLQHCLVSQPICYPETTLGFSSTAH